LVGQLRGLPADWRAAGSAVQSSITPAAFAQHLRAALQAANLAAAVAAAVPGIVALPRTRQIHVLYQKALTLVTNASRTAARQMVADVLDGALAPILQTSVSTLQTTIRAEVDRIMTTPPAGVARAAPADPQMAAMVAAMKAQLDANKAATAATTSRDPLGTGQAAPNQDVTYSAQGLMGRNRTDNIRSDQFGPMVTKFNQHLKLPAESDFTGETR
jgi:hypothetical protein